MPGVFITEGMRLRIPAGGLSLSLDQEGKPAGQLSIEVSLDVWPMWLDVAIEQALTASQARDLLRSELAAGPALAPDRQKELLNAQCTAGMIAICAAAFALDNFYSAIRDFVPGIHALDEEWGSAGTARHARITEAMRRTFKVTNAGGAELRRKNREIFKLRNWAVHPPADFREPLFYDLIDAGAEWRFVAFRAENAGAAAGLAARFISDCLNAPRQSIRGLNDWVHPRTVVARRCAERASVFFAGHDTASSNSQPDDPDRS